MFLPNLKFYTVWVDVINRVFNIMSQLSKPIDWVKIAKPFWPANEYLSNEIQFKETDS